MMEKTVSVSKVWGYERWLVNNDLYCGKILTIEPGFISSMHRHIDKMESFHVDKGIVHLEYGRPDNWTRINLLAGDTFTIHPGIFHRFRAIGATAVVFEFSTHHDDADVERLEESRAVR